MIATSRNMVVCAREVFVSKHVLVLWRVGERLDDKPHLHSICEDAVPDRTLGSNQRKDPRALGEIDEGLIEGSLEPLWSEARNRVAEQASLLPDMRISHCAVAPATRAHRHFRKHDGAAGAAFPAEQSRRLIRFGRKHDAGCVQRTHAQLHLVTNQTPRWRLSARNPALKTRVMNS